MLTKFIGLLLVAGVLSVGAEENRQDEEMPRIRGLALDMTLSEVKAVLEKKGYRLGPDAWGTMRTMPSFVSDEKKGSRVSAVKSYEIYVESETIETEREPGLFESVQGLNSVPQMERVVMKDPQGYVLVDKEDKVVGLSLTFAFMDAKGIPTEKVVQALEKRWKVRFLRTRVLSGDGREDIKYAYIDIIRGVAVTVSDLMFDKFVDLMKICGDMHPVNLD